MWEQLPAPSQPPAVLLEAQEEECYLYLDLEQSVRTYTFYVSSEAAAPIIDASASRRLSTVTFPTPLESPALPSLPEHGVKGAPPGGGSEGRRRLLARGGGGGGGKGGKNKGGEKVDSSANELDDTGFKKSARASEASPDADLNILRYLSLDGSNRLIGGILVHAQRREKVAASWCTTRFQNLAGRCLGQMVELRYGQDQALDNSSPLYSDVNIEEYYDVSPESGYLSQPARQPMPFAARTEALTAADGGRHHWYGSVFPAPAEGLRYPVMIGNTVNQGRAFDMIEFLKSGGYQNDRQNVVEVGAEMVVYNDQLMVLTLCSMRWDIGRGRWLFSMHTQPMKLKE
eukprot:gene5486-6649_t